jgi:hypothetical protein
MSASCDIRISFWVAHIIIIMGRAHHCDSDSGVVASFFSFLAMPMVVEIGENFPKLQQSLRDFLRGHCRMQHVHVVNLMVLIVEGVTMSVVQNGSRIPVSSSGRLKESEVQNRFGGVVWGSAVWISWFSFQWKG